MLPNKTVSYVYNPENQSDSELRERFIIRTKEYQRIINKLASASIESPSQHYLIQGQRGMGKTSLLLRIRSEVQREEALSYLLPVQFAEEQYGIFNLCRMWEVVAEELEDTKGFETLADELEEQAFEDDYDQTCFDTFERYLIKNNKRLLLLIDNFGDVLDKFPLNEQQRLRDIFHNSSHIQLIAATAQYLEQTTQHDKPFFEYFKSVPLKGLNQTDTNALLRKLAEVHGEQTHIEEILENQSHRIESIRRLTGGVPRTIVLLFEIFIDESGSVFDDLEGILDRVTPLYKHRMDDLSTQQQVIMDALALNWDGMSTKALFESIRDPQFTSKKISSQLQQLQKNGLVVTKDIDRKNKLYFLQERFFNIWYLMRYGRKKNKQNVLWLVSFLREWCSDDELHKRARKHIEAANEGRLHTKGYLMAESLGRLISSNELQHEVITSTRKALKEYIEDIDQKLTPSMQEIWDLALKEEKSNNYTQAIKHFKKLAEKENINAINRIGIIYSVNLKDFDKAIHFFQMAIESGSSDAMYNMGFLYYSEPKDFYKAIHFYQMAIDNGHINAMYNMGFLYKNELKDFDKTIHFYQMAIESGHTGAMYNLGLLYHEELKDFDKAIHFYQMAIDNGHINAMYNMGFLYNNELKDFDKAIHFYQMAIESGHTGAMRNMGYLYKNELKDFDKAIHFYQLAIDKGDTVAMRNMGFLYKDELKDFDKAIHFYQLAIDKGDTVAMRNMGFLYKNELKDFDKAIHFYQLAIDKGDTVAMRNMGFLYEDELKDFDKALHFYQLAIDKGHTDAMNGLAWLYYTLKKEPKKALELCLNASEDKSPELIHTFATTLLWNEQFADSIEKAREYLKHSDHYMEWSDDVADYFSLLLAKNQADAAYDLFQETPDLKNQIKPMYYATLELLKDKYPKEYLKMGSELEETVAEIQEKVKQKAIDYALPRL